MKLVEIRWTLKQNITCRKVNPVKELEIIQFRQTGRSRGEVGSQMHWQIYEHRHIKECHSWHGKCSNIEWRHHVSSKHVLMYTHKVEFTDLVSRLFQLLGFSWNEWCHNFLRIFYWSVKLVIVSYLVSVEGLRFSAGFFLWKVSVTGEEKKSDFFCFLSRLIHAQMREITTVLPLKISSQ